MPDEDIRDTNPFRAETVCFGKTICQYRSSHPTVTEFCGYMTCVLLFPVFVGTLGFPYPEREKTAIYIIQKNANMRLSLLLPWIAAPCPPNPTRHRLASPLLMEVAGATHWCKPKSVEDLDAYHFDLSPYPTALQPWESLNTQYILILLPVILLFLIATFKGVYVLFQYIVRAGWK